MLKNDTLKNGTSRIGLYGSAPPGTLSTEFLNLLVIPELVSWEKMSVSEIT